ncbi:hypothetical protein I0U45_02225 [Proteus mirabilis]|uniref:hypothetical protein n=1 Tax=Proteus mirabilis TaxID=584 RepID=UPI0018A6D95B|nr:hypothetical protein [Proteus mirabilis]MBF8452697.1 hypothetical protein [Proteus mirabilis]
MVKPTMSLRSQHVKNLAKRKKKMRAIEKAINCNKEADLLVIINKNPTLVFIK